MSTQILVKATVCELDHGGPHNEATVYGHVTRSDACLRIGDTDTWIHTPTLIDESP